MFRVRHFFISWPHSHNWFKFFLTIFNYNTFKVFFQLKQMQTISKLILYLFIQLLSSFLVRKNLYYMYSKWTVWCEKLFQNEKFVLSKTEEKSWNILTNWQNLNLYQPFLEQIGSIFLWIVESTLKIFFQEITKDYCSIGKAMVCCLI